MLGGAAVELHAVHGAGVIQLRLVAVFQRTVGHVHHPGNALLLLLKALFQDKLPPKWQFAVWSVLALMLLLQAGYHGRYVLVHWQLPIEMLKAGCGDFGFTQVYFPLPFVKAIPTTESGWLFVR